MNAFGRALSAELLKTKRTLALLMTLLAPAIIAVIQFAMYIQNRAYYLTHADQNQWLTLNQNSIVFWSLLMLPLFVTLETALLSGLEYGRKNWTLLYTLPVPRWAYYAAKELLSLALIGLSTAIMSGLIVLDGLILQAHRPGLWPARRPHPVGRDVDGLYALLYLSAFLIISIHLWVSSRWPNFVVALGVGIGATVTAAADVSERVGALFPVDHAGPAGAHRRRQSDGPRHVRAALPGAGRRRGAACRPAGRVEYWTQGCVVGAEVSGNLPQVGQNLHEVCFCQRPQKGVKYHLQVLLQ